MLQKMQLKLCYGLTDALKRNASGIAQTSVMAFWRLVMSKKGMLKSVALLWLLTGPSLVVTAQRILVKCRAEKESGAPNYSVERSMRSGHEPSEIYLFIYVEPKHFVREDMLALGRQLNKDFCKEERLRGNNL